MSTSQAPVHPEPAREFVIDRSPIPESFQAMDLSYYGAIAERSGDDFMELTYRFEQTVEQLVERWPKAVKAAGWVPIDEIVRPTGGFSGSYSTAEGQSTQLTIRPLGSLWVIDINVAPAVN